MTEQKDMEKIVAKLAPLGDVTARKMMGEYCIYLNGILIGDICDGTLFLKKFPENEKLLCDCEQRPPYQGAKPLYVAEFDSDEFLSEAVYQTFLGATAAKAKKKK